MAATTPMTVYGFSNVDISKQIIVADGVFAGISRANQTISIYHGETLIADCTMPATGIERIPTVVLGELTLHDETFTGFVEGETYTIVAGDEPPITGLVMNGGLFSFDPSALWAILSGDGSIISADYSNTRTNYTISQKITTTKKRYDIKRLPEELLPKTVATKAEVRTVQVSADAAKSTAETAKSTAETAKTTADAAKSTAETAKTTADAAKSTAETAQSTAETAATKAEVRKAQSTAETAQSTAESAATKTNPVFSGTFSQNRKSGSTVGTYSHAEGNNTVASGDASHAEGQNTSAENIGAHAEGASTEASADKSHAEGAFTKARGSASHAEGTSTEASGNSSHAEGYLTIAQGMYQHVQGAYNIAEGDQSSFSTDSYLHIVGNGRSNEARSNAHTLDWSGNAWFAGDVYVGSTSGTDKDAGSKKLATENYIDSKITGKEIYLTSSTPNSTKQFKLTVDDSGAISATEVVE